MRRGSSVVEWLRLVRLPNHATVVADVLAGALVAAGPREVAWPPPSWAVAVAAAAVLYAAGMVLNDAFDLEIDRVERPERPLPRGVIDRSTAFSVGFALLAAGVGLGLLAAAMARTPWPAVVAVGLAAAIWAYDAVLKATSLGPVAMGACRSLAWLLGMTVAGGPAGLAWLHAAGMGVYVAGVTLLARDEAVDIGEGGPPPTIVPWLGVATMGLGLAVAAGPIWSAAAIGARLPGGTLRADTWLVLWGIIGGSILARALPAAASPSPSRLQAAVGNAIMSIITLDAVLVLAACGERWALLLLSLLALFLLGRRIVPPS
jgi:hypothetical protein